MLVQITMRLDNSSRSMYAHAMNIEESIKSAMARYIERIYDISGVEVSSWTEEFDVYAYGGCETCGPEYDKEYSVDIYYTWDNQAKWHGFKGTFTDLIVELDKE